MMNDWFCRIIAGEIQARPEQVDAAVRLLDEGKYVPFIARYRRGNHRRSGSSRSCVIWKRVWIAEAGRETSGDASECSSSKAKLTDELANAINATLSETGTESLYLPYKPKRRTRGQIAIAAASAVG
ncbi:Tex-like N-terminal domain-containing protein [Escherichia coli]